MTGLILRGIFDLGVIAVTFGITMTVIGALHRAWYR